MFLLVHALSIFLSHFPLSFTFASLWLQSPIIWQHGNFCPRLHYLGNMKYLIILYFHLSHIFHAYITLSTHQFEWEHLRWKKKYMFWTINRWKILCEILGVIMDTIRIWWISSLGSSRFFLLVPKNLSLIT